MKKLGPVWETLCYNSLMTFRRKLVIGGILFCVALLLLYLVACFVLYERLSHLEPGYREAAGNVPSHFIHFPVGYERFDARGYYMPWYQMVSFPSRSPGIQISGWYISGSEKRPAIIVVHGYTSSKADARVLMMVALLHRHGFNVLAIDLRDNGGSTIEDGRTSLGVKEYNDVLGAKDWLVQQGYSGPNIGIVGASMGASTALIAFQKDPTIGALFLDSAYASLPRIVEERLESDHYPGFLMYGGILVGWVVSGDWLLAESPIVAMHHLSGRPVMIVHSTKDKVVAFWHAKRLVQEAKVANQPQVQTWFHSFEGHCNAIFEDTAGYESKVISFFDKALK